MGGGAGGIWEATWHHNHFFTPTNIILPRGLNSSCKILAISGAHIDSVTAMYLFPRKQDKCMDVQGKGRWWRRPGKIHVIKRRQHHKHSDPGRGENPILGANGQGWSSENLNGTPQKDQSEDDLYLTPKRYQLHLKWNRLDYQTLFGIKLEDQTWQSGRNQANKTGPFFELLSLWLHPERYFDVAKNSVFCHEHSS